MPKPTVNEPLYMYVPCLASTVYVSSFALVRRNPMIWASLFSRNVLPGVVNVYRSTHELLDRILDGQAPPNLDEGATPVVVSAFDPTRYDKHGVLNAIDLHVANEHARPAHCS